MTKCVILLAVVGLSSSYHHHGHGYYQSHPAYPSHRPDQWSHPGHHGLHGTSHSGSWHYHSGGFGRFNPNGSPTGNTRPWPKPSPNLGSHYPSQTDFDDDSDYDSDTDSDDDETDQGGNVSGETDDKVKNPSRFHQESNGNRQNDTLEQGKGQSDITGQIGATNSKPFTVNDLENDSLDRGDVPSAVDDINPRRRNIAKPTESTIKDTGNRIKKPVASQTNETNTSLTQAYITGPDNTLLKDLSANKTKLNQPISLNKPNSTGTFYPTTPSPRPGIGSIPVPILGQFLAPSLQWHVGIYTKTATPYSQICGGSLVKTDAVLTAAHCFWGDGAALRPALFAAAAGKLLRTWEDAGDVFAQKSDIKQIHIPPRFRGAITSFQDDIAIARLSSPFEYAPGVKPVCVDFDLAVEREQLQERGSKGTIVGWGLTEPNGPPSERLNFLALPYLEITECLKRVPATFIKYITSDKICAGDFSTGLAACKGDSGGGLVYTTNNVPYIRGIVSTAPRDANKYECNPYTPATFTQITAHMTFLTDHIPNIAEDCRTMYEFEVQNATVENDSKGIGSGETNIAENSQMMSEVQRTVENSVGNKSGGNSNAASGQLKTNVTTQSEERKSNGVPTYSHLNTSTGQRHECNCFCN